MPRSARSSSTEATRRTALRRAKSTASRLVFRPFCSITAVTSSSSMSMLVRVIHQAYTSPPDLRRIGGSVRSGAQVRNTRLVPPRTRRRASPRPAPVVHQDLYSEASLRASHAEASGHQARPPKRRTRSEPAATPATPATPATDDQSDDRESTTDEVTADHPALAPPR